MQLGRLYQSVLDKLERVVVFATTVLLGLLLLNETLGIASDFYGKPIPWISEVSVLLFSWVVFLGAAILARYGDISPWISSSIVCRRGTPIVFGSFP